VYVTVLSWAAVQAGHAVLLGWALWELLVGSKHQIEADWMRKSVTQQKGMLTASIGR
jgi:hypothetical protein